MQETKEKRNARYRERYHADQAFRLRHLQQCHISNLKRSERRKLLLSLPADKLLEEIGYYSSDIFI